MATPEDEKQKANSTAPDDPNPNGEGRDEEVSGASAPPNEGDPDQNEGSAPTEGQLTLWGDFPSGGFVFAGSGTINRAALLGAPENDLFGPVHSTFSAHGKTTFTIPPPPGELLIVRPEEDPDPPETAEPPSTANAGGYDPMFSHQWYLNSASGMANINVVPAWRDFTGDSVKVAVCDDGVEYTHPDLAANYLLNSDYDAESKTGDGKPHTSSDNHGTAVAGFIGAAKNGYGIVGVAYESSFASLRSGTEPESADALSKAASFDVCSNSWTFAPFSPTPNVDTALQTIAETGRDGLGTVTTFCASNERAEGIMSTYYTMNNSPYTSTVGAVDSTGHYADFSCAGPDILVTAPGVDVITTDREPGGYVDGAYFWEENASGTSFSTPLVSGVVALMLEANPTLGYRDAQSILAYTATRSSAMTSDTSKPWDWQINDASNWNGGGLHASHDYGFGLVDATAAVRLAESWDYGQHTTDNLETTSASAVPSGLTIPDGTGGALSSTMAVASDMLIQQALVTVDISHARFDDLEISLTSPNGTASTLMYHPSLGGLIGQYGCTTAELLTQLASKTFVETDTWTFKTVMPFGETGTGDWTLTVKDTVAGDEGTFNSWSMTLYGDTATANDHYVYTDEFSTVSGESGRTTLADTGGTDTINASAVTSSSSINLTPDTVSVIDGVDLTITTGTVIENVHTGDGNDSITGNTADNNLFGWRGDDIISGGAGNDLLFGGTGSDQLTGGAGSDLFHYSETDDAVDSITDFNHAEDGFTFEFVAFGQSATGTLSADHFFTSEASVDVADDCFIFDDGTLWYDADGTGADLAVDLAQIVGDAVQADDIQFV